MKVAKPSIGCWSCSRLGGVKWAGYWWQLLMAEVWWGDLCSSPPHQRWLSMPDLAQTLSPKCLCHFAGVWRLLVHPQGTIHRNENQGRRRVEAYGKCPPVARLSLFRPQVSSTIISGQACKCVWRVDWHKQGPQLPLQPFSQVPGCSIATHAAADTCQLQSFGLT